MNKIFLISRNWQKVTSFFALMLLTSIFAFAQTINGTVTSEKGEKLPGVSVVINGTTKGTTTDKEGNYSIDVAKGQILSFSFVGYELQEVVISEQKTINILLKEATESLEEVVVTGVFDKRTALESSIAISTLSSKSISKIATNSAADLLSYTPGVYVNSSVGEINNTVYSRGVNANQFAVAGGNGYYYVALMEDGLPTTNLSSGNIVADYFYRADATLSRLEAVRGGSASITGNNSPGGIFNYITNTGEKAVNKINYKTGLEGDGKNLYNNLSANFGGKLGSGNWFYNLGGFYRASDGARNPGYLLNKGGQIKANLLKKNSNGSSLKIYGKYLNDRNALPQALPAQNYDKPQIASGFSNTDSYMLPKAEQVQPLFGPDKTFIFNPANLVKSTDATLGIDLNLNLKNGWTLNNNIKGAAKTVEQNLTIMSTPTSLTSLLTYALMGMIAPGTITLTDRNTGNLMAEINADFSRGPSWKVTKNNLPGQNIMQDGVLFNLTSYSKTRLNEVMDQISINKKIGKNSITIGSYLAYSDINTSVNGTAGTNLRTIESKSSPLDVKLKLPNGPTMQITSPEGYAQLSGGRFNFTSYGATQTQASLFVGDGIQASEKLNLDLGIRYDYIGVKGVNYFGKENPNAAAGGIDNNPLTLYDNFYFVKDREVTFDTKLNLLSYSAGINYLINKNNSVYARFSNGQKAPDMQFYFSGFNDSKAKPTAKAQTITQLEMGYKTKGPKISASFIPFYSKLSNVPVATIAQDTNNVAYYTPTVFNSLRTIGIESEISYQINKNFTLAGNITLQNAKATVWQTWIVGNNGKADDKVVNFNGNTSENVPRVMFNIMPSYNFKKGFVMLTYKYMGARQANVSNAFTLPGFGQTNLSAGYEITPKLSVNANINNLTNTLGIMNWMATTKYALVDAFGHDSFTPQRRKESPDSYFQIIPIQPRAFFLALNYNF